MKIKKYFMYDQWRIWVRRRFPSVLCLFGDHSFIKSKTEGFEEECQYCGLLIKIVEGYRIHWRPDKKYPQFFRLVK